MGKSMVLVQNWPFCHLFVFGNLGQENVFYDILEHNNAFVGFKSKKLKQKTKFDMFSKGIVLGFGPKLAIFPSFVFRQYRQNWPFFHLLFLGNIGRENVFYDIVELENDFLGYKNSKFKKWKN